MFIVTYCIGVVLTALWIIRNHKRKNILIHEGALFSYAWPVFWAAILLGHAALFIQDNINDRN